MVVFKQATKKKKKQKKLFKTKYELSGLPHTHFHFRFFRVVMFSIGRNGDVVA